MEHINRFGNPTKKRDDLKFDYNFGDVVLKNNGLAYLITGFGIYDNQVWGSPLYPDGIHLGGDEWLSDKEIIKKADDVTLLKKIYEEYIKSIVDNYNKFFKDSEYKEEQEDIVKRHLKPIFDLLFNLRQVGSLVWGVFTRDCYGIPKEEVENYLLKTFEDYGEALIFAQSVGEKSAIHLTDKRKKHKPEVAQCGLSQKNTKEVRHSSH